MCDGGKKEASDLFVLFQCLLFIFLFMGFNVFKRRTSGVRHAGNHWGQRQWDQDMTRAVYVLWACTTAKARFLYLFVNVVVG